MATPAAGWTLPRLRIDRHGDWFDGDVQVTHARVLANLRANLRRDAAGYHIQTRVRIPVEVEDVPWVVTRLACRDERLLATLNDDTEEAIDPGSLRIGPGGVPYCAVKGGAFDARLNRAAAYQLLTLVDYDQVRDRGLLRLGGREYRLTPPAEREGRG